MTAPPAPPPWVLVSGDFTPLGGMDRANHGLAKYLAGRPGAEVHVVSHRVWDDLAGMPAVRVHRVPRPWGKHWLGEPFLDRAGRRVARETARGREAHVLVNGGNCRAGGVNWVHYVHAAWTPSTAGLSWFRALKVRRYHAAACRAERASLARARVVVANSDRTRRDLVEKLNLDPSRVHTVYYGVDPAAFRPPTGDERAEARARLGWSDDRPTVAFVGALGDGRKGFDTLLSAWEILASRPGWDARLAVIGAGASLAHWKDRARALTEAGSVEFLGFRGDVPAVLRACDALASPVRYEAYGLNVHEALCTGLPAVVSADAGVAERYPAELAPLKLPDPDDAGDLADRLRHWRDHAGTYARAALDLAGDLRRTTWDEMAARIVRVVERGG